MNIRFVIFPRNELCVYTHYVHNKCHRILLYSTSATVRRATVVTIISQSVTRSRFILTKLTLFTTSPTVTCSTATSATVRSATVFDNYLCYTLAFLESCKDKCHRKPRAMSFAAFVSVFRSYRTDVNKNPNLSSFPLDSLQPCREVETFFAVFFFVFSMTKICLSN